MSYGNIVGQIRDILDNRDLDGLIDATIRYSRRQRREISHYYEESYVSSFSPGEEEEATQLLKTRRTVSEKMRKNYLSDAADTILSVEDTGVIRRDLTVTEARMLDLAAMVAASSYSPVLAEDIGKCFRGDMGALLSYWWSDPLDLQCRLLHDALRGKGWHEYVVSMCVFMCRTEVDWLRLCNTWHSKHGTDLREHVYKWANPKRSGHSLVLSWLTYDKITSPSADADALTIKEALDRSDPDFDSIIRVFGLRLPEEWKIIVAAYKRRFGHTLEEVLASIRSKQKDKIFFALAHASLLGPTAFTCSVLDIAVQNKASPSYFALIAGAFCDAALRGDDVYADELYSTLTRYPRQFTEIFVSLWTAAP
ncbi:Hypothetical protein DHA2_152603 [Giardia duodenalis]|uniref:Alpha-16 giardin n=1 Tax=Giardia intestinalis TaxID=5741 RepID=V6TBN7_GIAIN|nr:Hypothetical protein DHA2_152603 [Giardia intestinalis]